MLLPLRLGQLHDLRVAAWHYNIDKELLSAFQCDKRFQGGGCVSFEIGKFLNKYSNEAFFPEAKIECDFPQILTIIRTRALHVCEHLNI